ncbi:MAG: hypothetical protein Tsb0034_26060 [Ekhidna sp.]
MGREEEMRKLGIQTVRFTNQKIENDLIQVLTEIESFCKKALIEKEKTNLNQPSTPPLKGEADSGTGSSPLQGVGGNKSEWL